LTALATPGAATQLPVSLRPAYFYDSPQYARVLVAANIRLEKIPFKKKRGQLAADLDIMGAAYSEDGGMAARFSETLPISFDKDKESEFRKATLPYRNYFRLRPGKYRLKLAAADEAGNLGAAEQSLEVPVYPAQGFTLSSLVVAEHLSQLPELIKNLQTQLLDQSDPLLFSKMQIEPSVANKLPVGSAAAVMFRMYNLADTPDQWEGVAKPRLLDEKGREISLPPIQLKETMEQAGPTDAVVALRLPFQNAPAGKYRLQIEIALAGSAQSATLQTDLEFF
jgi:hypothetical protein